MPFGKLNLWTCQFYDCIKS